MSAECIAANAERPLLTLTSADIGTSPESIEENLTVWFKKAASWRAIILIDEAGTSTSHLTLHCPSPPLSLAPLVILPIVTSPPHHYNPILSIPN